MENQQQRDTSNRRAARRLAGYLALLALALGAIGTIAVSTLQWQEIESKATLHFEQRAERLEVEIARRFERVLGALTSVAGMYTASDYVTAEEFETFVDALNFRSAYPGLTSLGFAAVDRLTGVRVEAAHPTEPNGIFTGLDLGADPTLAAAVEQARATSQAVLVRPSRHMASQLNDRTFLLLLPIYALGTAKQAPPLSGAHLRPRLGKPTSVLRILDGVVIGLVDAELLLRDVPATTDGELAFALLDDQRDSAAPALFDSRTEAAIDVALRPEPAFSSLRTLTAHSRPLAIRVSSTTKLDAASDQSPLIWATVAGSLLTVLAAVCVWLLAFSRQRAVALAEQMTTDLSRLAMVAETTSNSVIITDPTSRITWVNRGFVRLFGYSEAEAIGRFPEDLLHFDKTDAQQAASIRDAFARQGTFKGDILNRGKHGQDHWVHVEVQPMRDPTGAVSGFIAIQTDITPTVVAAEAISRERKRLDAILDGAHVGAMEWNLQTGEMKFSARSAAMLGYDSASLPQMNETLVRRIVHRDDLAKHDEALRRYLNGESDHFECELRLPHRNGHWIWVLSRFKIVSRTADGRPEWVAGTQSDISRRKASETLLQVKEEQLRRITASVPGVVFEVALSADGKPSLRFISDGSFEMFDVAPFEAQRNPSLIADVLSPAEQAAALASLAQSARTLEPWKREFHVDINGLKWVAASALPQPQDDGSTVWYGLFTDVTDQKRAEAQLAKAIASAEQAVAAKSAFLATMSHEIRTPMNGVIGMAEVLANTSLNEEQVDAVQTIRESGSALLRIIDDILDFSKIEAGRMSIERTAVSLPSLVEGACDGLTVLARNAGVGLDVFVDPSLPEMIWTDPTRLRQVLFNLVGNAIKFSSGVDGRDGAVSLRAERCVDAPGNFRLKVLDNGIGMSPDTLDRLFEAFTQGEVSTTRRFGGTGLGLAICRRLTEMMKGRIDVESAVDKGSAFIVTLPLEPAPDQPSTRTLQLDGVRCVIVTAGSRRVDDLYAYLNGSGAVVEVADCIATAMVFARRSTGPIVVVHDDMVVALNAGSTLTQYESQGPDVRHLVLGRGCRGAARIVAPNIATLDLLRRGALIRAVGMLAGICSPEVSAAAWSAADGKPLDAHQIAQTRVPTTGPILVAEDDPINQKVIARQLEILGFKSVIAASGDAALDCWRTGRFALLLTDLHMPGMDGYTLARRIRHEENGSRRMPILALTANALRGEAERAIAAGMDEYLTKPVQIRTLAAALTRWLTESASNTQTSTSSAVQERASSIEQLKAVDLDVLRGLVGDDPTTIDQFLADYAQALAQMASALEAAYRSDDQESVMAIAHKLKSASRSVGAMRLGDICAEIESHLRHGLSSALSADVASFSVAVADAMRAVDGHLERETT